MAGLRSWSVRRSRPAALLPVKSFIELRRMV